MDLDLYSYFLLPILWVPDTDHTRRIFAEPEPAALALRADQRAGVLDFAAASPVEAVRVSEWGG